MSAPAYITDPGYGRYVDDPHLSMRERYALATARYNMDVGGVHALVDIALHTRNWDHIEKARAILNRDHFGHLRVPA